MVTGCAVPWLGRGRVPLVGIGVLGSVCGGRGWLPRSWKRSKLRTGRPQRRGWAGRCCRRGTWRSMAAWGRIGMGSDVRRRSSCTGSSARGPALEQRLRERLPRAGWRLSALLPRSTPRASCPPLASLVPPRVLAAVLRLWFGGWCASTRMGSPFLRTCCWGCQAPGSDSSAHYVRGPVLWRWRRLRFPQWDWSLVDSHVLLDSDMSPNQLAAGALSGYAVYTVYNSWRYGALSAFQTYGALEGALKEGARGFGPALGARDGLRVPLAPAAKDRGRPKATWRSGPLRPRKGAHPLRGAPPVMGGGARGGLFRVRLFRSRPTWGRRAEPGLRVRSWCTSRRRTARPGPGGSRRAFASAARSAPCRTGARSVC